MNCTLNPNQKIHFFETIYETMIILAFRINRKNTVKLAVTSGERNLENYKYSVNGKVT